MITGRFKDMDLIIKINLEKDKGIINIDISQKDFPRHFLARSKFYRVADYKVADYRVVDSKEIKWVLMFLDFENNVTPRHYYFGNDLIEYIKSLSDMYSEKIYSGEIKL